ncbi:MAG: acyltransferase family protein [Gammaproteobacteria bacterium]|nr:acyltransferase family protein [Gammaproteobacteria bacterium]
MDQPLQRRFHLDWLRIAAFALLVLYHVGMYYVSWDWHINRLPPVSALEPFMLLTSPWRLSLLFLVSGTATAFLVARGAPAASATAGGGFMRDRSRRLLLPLAVGMVLVVPPQSYYEVLEKLPGGFDGGYLAFWGRYLAADGSFCAAPGECLILPTWNHLWFVAYLWVYTLVLWLLLRFAPGTLAVAGGWARRLLAGPGLVLWPVLLLALARITLLGPFGSTHALVDDWYNHLQYFPLFLLGYLVAMDEEVWARMQALRWPALAMALGSWALLAWYFVHYTDASPPDAIRALQRAAWAFNQWTAIVAAVGFARRLAPGDGPLRRYLTDAVFPVYIFHQTITVVAAWHLRPLGLAPGPEGLLLVLLTFGLSFAGYEAVRRVRWLRPLFGLRREPASSTSLLHAPATRPR